MHVCALPAVLYGSGEVSARQARQERQQSGTGQQRGTGDETAEHQHG